MSDPSRSSALLFLILLVSGLLAASTSRSQTVSVDEIPPYGVLGSITGSITGADPALHHVAVYIQIEGAGWWTKPTFAHPTVPIRSDGTFTADVGTGGPQSLDSRATIFCAALLPRTETPPRAAGSVRIPASLSPLAIHCRERYGRTMQFAGATWAVKEAPLPAGPGQNVFSDRPEDVFVDEDGLHLRVAFHDNRWWSTEVILLKHLGYGTYAIQTDSELDDLDVNVTFGMFIWDSYGDEETVPNAPNREIDFEDSRWGDPSDSTNAQMVVQPYTDPENLRRYTIPDLSADSALTRFFTWSAEAIDFVALRGHRDPFSHAEADVIDEYLYTHAPPLRRVPSVGRERFRLNLWLNNVELGGSPPPRPANLEPVDVVITDVIYTPEPGRPWLQTGALVSLAAMRSARRRKNVPSRALRSR